MINNNNKREKMNDNNYLSNIKILFMVLYLIQQQNKKDIQYSSPDCLRITNSSILII